MECNKVVFSGHAVRRMFERRISRDDVLQVLGRGEVIADYPDDMPYPSQLLVGFAGERAIHMVVAVDPKTKNCHVVTVYQPDPGLWEPGWRERRPR